MAINDNTSYELFGYQVKDLATKIKSKAEAASLAPVATSGLYSDLTGAPTIPTVYNGTLTIQQNGTTVDTFTANSSADKTVNIETITAETVAPAEEVGAITSNMIADEAVTASKIDWLSAMNKIYPVGSIYMSATMSTVVQVQTALGGTWVKWGAGRVPVGVDTSQTEFNTVGKTGGEKTHTLTVDEMPSHNHSFAVPPRYGWEWQNGGGIFGQKNTTAADNTQLTEKTGGDQAHNNMPPYITCYMYKRTA